MENQTVGSEASARTLAKALGSAENFGPSNRLSCVRDRARLWKAGSRNYQEERKEGGSPRFQEVLLFCTWGAGWIPQEVTTPLPDSFAIRSFPRLNTFGIRQEVALVLGAEAKDSAGGISHEKETQLSRCLGSNSRACLEWVVTF